MKKWIFLLMCLVGPAQAADVKISQLPLGSAIGTNVNDSFPYVDSVNGVTRRLKLSDLINIPALSSSYAPINSPTFTGTVTAPTFVGALTGNATTATTSANFGGALSGDVTGTQSATVISNATVTGKALTGFVSGPGTLSASDSILTAFNKLNGNVSILAGGVTALTGDVTATGPGSSAATVALVGGSTAADVDTATSLVNGVQSGNKFLASPSNGSSGAPTFRAIIPADVPTLNQNTSGNAATVTTNANLTGPITSIGNATSIASQTGTGSTFAMSASPSFTGTLGAVNILASGTVGGSNLSAGGHAILDLTIANNLSDVASASTSFNNISPMTTLGDIIYGGSSGSGSRLAGNISSTRNYLVQTGTGSVSAAPTWGTIAAADISGLTNSNLSGSAAISNANLASMAAHTYKGNNTGSGSTPLDVSSTQLTADLDAFTSSLKGVVPGSGGGSANFLRADGTWAVPPGGGSGTVSSVALTVPAFLSVTGSPVTTTGTLAVSFSGSAIPIANGGTAATSKAGAFDSLSPMTTGGDLIYGGASGTGTRLANGSSGQVLTSNGTTLAPSWQTGVSFATQTAGTFLAGPTSGSAATPTFRSLQAPTMQQLTTGSGATYTTPAGVLWIEIEMCGPGGGGSGSGTGPGTGGTGVTTTFSGGTLSAAGGVGAIGGSGTGGLGGAASGGYLNITGGQGAGSGAGTTLFPTGQGGASPLGNIAAAATQSSPGFTGQGFCVGGGGSGTTGTDVGGRGGGGGGYLKKIITSPAGSYTYTVSSSGGSAGAAGSGGQAGAAGQPGIIYVREYYQ